MSRKKKKQRVETYEMNEYAAGKAAELLGEMFDQVCNEIDDEFFAREEDLRTFISVLIGTEYFYDRKPLPHYRWIYDGCPYDYSGELVRDGYIDTNITLGEFLEEFRGDKEATYISGWGWKYTRYEEEVSFELLDIGEMIMRSVIERYVDKNLLTGNSEWLFFDNIHDSFYDNTLTSSFFCTELIDGSGLSILDYDMPLKDYLQIGKPYWKAFLSKLANFSEETGSSVFYAATKYEIFCSLPKIVGY